MTRRAIQHWELAATAAATLAFHAAAPAFADEPVAKTTVAEDLSLEVPEAPADDAQEGSRWFSPNLHLHKKSGLAYTRHVKFADTDLVFGVHGPVLRKQEALGLTFKIRF
jgi:hypothetical protein